MFSLRFTSRGSPRGEGDYHTAADALSVRLTLDAWAREHRPHLAWAVEVFNDRDVTVARYVWGGAKWVRL